MDDGREAPEQSGLDQLRAKLDARKADENEFLEMVVNEWKNRVTELESQLKTAREALERILELPSASVMKAHARDALARIGAGRTVPGRSYRKCPYCDFATKYPLAFEEHVRCRHDAVPEPQTVQPQDTSAPREELAKTLHSVAYPDANFCLDRPECRARLREADAIIAAGWRKGNPGPYISGWNAIAKRYAKALANVYKDRVEYQAALEALTSACRAAAIKDYEAARLPDPNR